MTIPSELVCPQLTTWGTKEVALLNVSLQRTARGLDPSVAMKALRDSVATDLASNATNIAKAAVEGLGSEFTRGLIKAAVDEVIEQISANFPETRNIVSKIQNITDNVFSIIQILFTLADNSPLTIAAKTKGYIQEDFTYRDNYVTNVSARIDTLLDLCKSIKTSGPISETVKTSAYSAVSKLNSANSHLDNVRVKMLRKIIDLPSLENAKSELKSALQILSPLDEKLDGDAVTTNEEIIELIDLGYDDITIELKILRAASINSFDFSANAVAQLTEAGMSERVKRVFLSIKGRHEKTPEQIVAGKIRKEIQDILDDTDSITSYSSRIIEMIENYQTIRIYLDTPKQQDTHAQGLYVRIIDYTRSKIASLVKRMEQAANYDGKTRPGEKQERITDIESWISEIAALLSTLELIKKGMYNDKKINSKPINTVYFNAYESSVDAMEGDDNLDTLDTINNFVGFSDGIDVVYEIIGVAQAVTQSLTQSDVDFQVNKLESKVNVFKAFVTSLKRNVATVNGYLDLYSPTPEASATFDKIFELLDLTGMDRLRDELLKGNMQCLLDMDPEMASYAGSAAQCIRYMARQAANEYEKSKFLKAAKKIDGINRAKILGKVHLSDRSFASVKYLKDRILQIQSLIKNLLNVELSGEKLENNGSLLRSCNGNS
jgi:hypothetical protein